MSNTLHVTNLQPWVTSEDLARKFRCCGLVNSASVISDRKSGESSGCGYVEMASEVGAENAVKQLNSQQYDGQTITVRAVESYG